MARVLPLAPLAASLWLVASAAFANAVAFVTDLQGEARLANGARVAFLGELPAGARLKLERDARVHVMYIAAGTEFALVGPGEYVADANEVTAVSGAAPKRRSVAVRPDPGTVMHLAATATASVRMRSASAPPAVSKRPALLYPRTGPIASLQPTLAWAADVPPAGFTVVVTAADGKPVWRGTSKAGSVKVGTRLAPGSPYAWTLLSGDTTLGEARFETLGAEALRRAEASAASAKTFSDRILHAFVLQDVGATQDARRAWAELARERPDLPELGVLAR